MDIQTFNENCYEVMDKVQEILNNKGLEYRTDEDVFSNFISTGKQLGLTEYQIWNVYFSKHIASINNAIKLSPDKPGGNMCEPLDGRIVDAIAYLCLLYGMTKRP